VKNPLQISQGPDYRKDNPYQTLLNRALNKEQIRSNFINGHHGAKPLENALNNDALHLHWADSFWKGGGRVKSWWRGKTFASTLKKVAEQKPLFITAHL